MDGKESAVPHRVVSFHVADRRSSPEKTMESVVHLPIDTNGYVSTWGAVTSVCPPKVR
jgi:hypothetical protein